MSQRHRIRLTTPADIASFVPYLLGFHPHQRLVVLAEHDHQVLFAATLALPTGDTQAFTGAVADLHGRLTQRHIGAVWLIGYGEQIPVAAAVHTITAVLDGTGITVREALRVNHHRIWHLRGGEGPFPAEGIPFDPHTTAAAAEATFAGLMALPDRQAVTAHVAPTQGLEREAFARAIDAAAAEILTGDADDTQLYVSTMRLTRRGLDRHRDGERLSDAHAARLVVLLTVDPLRIGAGRFAVDDPARLALWADLTRRADRHFAAAPATLLALAALQDGNGALARDALTRALQASPNDQLAQLLSQAMQLGIDPDTVSNLLRD